MNRSAPSSDNGERDSVGDHLKGVASDTERLFKARLRLFQAQVGAAGPELKQTVALGAVANIVLTAGAVILMIALARGAEAALNVSYPLVLFVLGLAAVGAGVFFIVAIKRRVQELKNLFRLTPDTENEGLK